MHANPTKLVQPQYWVEREEAVVRFWSQFPKKWTIGFRDTAPSTNERTFIASLVPFSAIGNNLPVLNSAVEELNLIMAFLANLNSYVFDYAARQKVGGSHLNFFIVEQLPILLPSIYTPDLLDFIVPRVLELTYTAWDLQPFAQDVGWDGPPFIWDEDRRFLMRCELDALYFHLYGIARDDVDYIMETFPIVKRKDEKQFEEYRTKRVILEMYDQMAKAGGVSGYQTWLSPGPSDPSVAHEERSGDQ
jgi:hypothetical protein